jgi:hypothetical protein
MNPSSLLTQIKPIAINKLRHRSILSIVYFKMSIRYLNRPSLIIAGIPKSYNFESLEASLLTAYNDAVKKALLLLKEVSNEKIPES